MGPLVAAAAMVYGGHMPLLRDSKLLIERERATAYRWLMEHSWFGVGVASAQQIDHLGIVKANSWAMERAFLQLLASAPCRPAFVLVDAVPLLVPAGMLATPPAGVIISQDALIDPWGKIIAFPQSEEFSYSIAAASIIAKVTRDRLIAGLGKEFPGYSFERHKGYATECHRTKLAERGRTLVHRVSFHSVDM